MTDSFYDFHTFDPNSITRKPRRVPDFYPSAKKPKSVPPNSDYVETRLRHYLSLHSGKLNSKLIALLGSNGEVEKILRALDMQDFRLADELYLKLSIGESAWPIGGINLGIVQQSERKVPANPSFSQNNDSILELKRLLTLERQKAATAPIDGQT